jgi:hypothetical protein
MHKRNSSIFKVFKRTPSQSQLERSNSSHHQPVTPRANSDTQIRRQDSSMNGSFSGSLRQFDYEFDFNNCMKVPEAKELFGKFLQSEYNSEPLQFLDAVIDFKEQISKIHDDFLAKQKKDTEIEWKEYTEIHQEYKKNAKQIIDTFLEEGAKKEVNIAADVKRSVVRSYNSLNEHFDQVLDGTVEKSSLFTSSMGLKQQHFHLFSGVQSQLMIELSMDVFPRFIRSSMWKAFILKKDITFVKKIGYRKDAQKLRELLYTYEDWINPMITDHDFEFNRRMTEDSSNWNLTKTHNEEKDLYEQSTLYMMKNEFIIGDGLPAELQNRTLAKIVLYLPYNYLYVAQTVTSKWIEGMDKIILETEHFDYTKADIHAGKKYATTFYVSRMKFGPEFILDKRELYLSASMILDPVDPNNIIYVTRDLKPMHDKPKGWERASTFIMYRFQKINDNLTRFTSVYSVNMGGKMKIIGGFANKGVMKKRVRVYRDQLMTALEKRTEMEKTEGKKHLESNGKFDSLIENTTNLAHLYDDSSLEIRSQILGKQLEPKKVHIQVDNVISTTTTTTTVITENKDNNNNDAGIDIEESTDVIIEENQE